MIMQSARINTKIYIRVENDVNNEAEAIKKLPYKIPKFGCMKGKMREAIDHDWFEPLEDFKEYM
jgi:hypothetical protein